MYVEILSTWAVWRALKRLELHEAQPSATHMPLLCSPNFPCAQYFDICTLIHELIVKLYIHTYIHTYIRVYIYVSIYAFYVYKLYKLIFFLLTEHHEVTKCSLLLSCCGNSSVEKPHETELWKLQDLLEEDEAFKGM